MTAKTKNQKNKPTNRSKVVHFSKTKSHQRYKLSDGTIVPGGSTIAKIGDDTSALMYWAWKCGMDGKDYRKVKCEAADIGSLAHFLVECHLRGQTPDYSEFSKQDLDRAMVAFN